MKTFAGWLADQMQRAKLSQSEVARRANLNQAAVSRLLSGRTAPTAETIKALARALKLPPEEVFRAAGLLPPNPEVNEYDEEGNFLLRTLNPKYKKRALNQLKLLHQEQEDEGQDGSLNPEAQPR